MPDWALQLIQAVVAAVLGVGGYTARERMSRRNGHGNGQPITLDLRWKEGVDRDMGSLTSTVRGLDGKVTAGFREVKAELRHLRNRIEERND